jgi:hypothetical protein
MNLVERLAEAGIVNPHDFAERGGAKVFVAFYRDHPHASSYKQYRAVAWVRIGSEWVAGPFPASEGDSVPDKRRIAVEAAQEWAGEHVGGAEWVAGPFPDSWQCKETREAVLALLDGMRDA